MHKIMVLASLNIFVFVTTASIPAGLSGAPQSATIQVNTHTDSLIGKDDLCSLREAIVNANNNDQSGSTDCTAGTAGLDVINIQVSGEILLAANLPTITDSLAVYGDQSGTSISGGDNYSVFNFSPSDEAASIILQDLTIEHGYAGLGAAVSKNSGSAEIRGCTIKNNRSTHAGAIYNGSGNMTIINSTIIENEAEAGVDSTGGEVYNGSGWTVTIINSTFKDNSAFTSGSTLRNSSGLMYVYNSIIARGLNSDNCSGTIINSGNNIDTGTSCGFGSDKGSLSSTNPQLGTLGMYGGPTETIFLLLGSPAIDGVVYNAPNSSPNWDQRSIPRPLDGDGDTIARHDIGSYEYGEPKALFLPVIIR
jgi:CSLREA domain-containing protein